MILVLGVWTSSAPFSATPPRLLLRTLPCVINWRSCSGQSLALGSADGTASSGSAFHASGRTGGPASSLFSPRPSSLGTAKAFSSTGAGSPVTAQWVARLSILSSAR